MKKYRVTLTDGDRLKLQAMIAAGKAAAKTLAHARIRLKADQADGGPAWPDHRIAEALEVSVATVERVRQRLVEHRLNAALSRKEQDRPSRRPVLDGRAEARLIALACSAPLGGREAWTLRLLADQSDQLMARIALRGERTMKFQAPDHPADGSLTPDEFAAPSDPSKVRDVQQQRADRRESSRFAVVIVMPDWLKRAADAAGSLKRTADA